MNKELRKQFSGTHKAGVDGAAMSTRHTTVDDGGTLQSVTEVRACQTSADADDCHCVLHTLVCERWELDCVGLAERVGRRGA